MSQCLILYKYSSVNLTLVLFFSISLVMKEEASDYLELETIKNLVRKYSQFINFPIYVWSSKVRYHVDASWPIE